MRKKISLLGGSENSDLKSSQDKSQSQDGTGAAPGAHDSGIDSNLYHVIPTTHNPERPGVHCLGFKVVKPSLIMRGLDFKVNSSSGEKGEKREGRRKEAQAVPLHLLSPGKMKAVQLFLRGLEKLVVINRNLT